MVQNLGWWKSVRLMNRILPPLILLLALLLAVHTVRAASPASHPTTSAAATAPAATQYLDPDDDPNSDSIGTPALGLFALVMFLIMGAIAIVFLVFAAIAIVLGIVAALIILFLLAVGILSTSVLFAFLRRSVGSGFRALFIQIGMVVGLPLGLAATWIASRLFAVPGGRLLRYGAGGICGVLAGFAVAILFNYLWGRLIRWAFGMPLPAAGG